jgi:pyruvate carboxylase
MGYPESVIDMLSGGLGEPMGGWPPALLKACARLRQAA